MQPKANSWLVRKLGYGVVSVILAALGVVMCVVAGDWENLTSGVFLLVGALSSAVATSKTGPHSDEVAPPVVEIRRAVRDELQAQQPVEVAPDWSSTTSSPV